MAYLEEQDLTDFPTIPEFYKGKTVLITGGTGFMGKVLIEKLLYSCTELENIYLILRAKKGVNPKERLQKLYTSPCFNRLREERSGVFESKVHVLAGDVSEVGLDLSPEDRELIINKVNIIFHVAASVRFDDALQKAVNINLRSTVEIMAIAKECKHFNVYVHVSTAYANTQWNPIEEKMYPPYADWKDTLKICNEMDEKTINIFSHKYLGDLPNTYIFTKQLSEQAVYEQRGKLPIVITRPSIVVAARKEPCCGWIENFNGPVGIIVGVGKGILRCLYSSKDFSGNYVPVDDCIKHFITASWIRGTKKLEPTDDIEIYNCCTMDRVNNADLVDIGFELNSKLPLESSIWTVNCTLTTSKTVYYFNGLVNNRRALLPLGHCIYAYYVRRLCHSSPDIVLLIAFNDIPKKLGDVFLFGSIVDEPDEAEITRHGRQVLIKHLLPALLVDMILWISGGKPMLLKLQKRIFINNLAIQKFMITEWIFTSTNVNKLRSCIKKEDMKEFTHDLNNFFNEEYLLNCFLVSKKYLLNEKEENIPKAREQSRRLILLDKILTYVVYGVVGWAIIRSNFMLNMYNKLL